MNCAENNILHLEGKSFRMLAGEFALSIPFQILLSLLYTQYDRELYRSLTVKTCIPKFSQLKIFSSVCVISHPQKDNLSPPNLTNTHTHTTSTNIYI